MNQSGIGQAVTSTRRISRTVTGLNLARSQRCTISIFILRNLALCIWIDLFGWACIHYNNQFIMHSRKENGVHYNDSLMLIILLLCSNFDYKFIFYLNKEIHK